MHELAICQSLLGEVGRVAMRHRACEVTEIVVAVGPLSGVEPQLLERAFSVARAGTIAARATLKFEATPVVVWCKACDLETTVAANALLCGRCETWQAELMSGNELLLKCLELAETDETAAAN